MSGFSTSDVARMLDLPVSQIRLYAKAGLLQATRGPRGEYRFSFQDLVLLRTAKGLLASRIPPKTIRRALGRLKQRFGGDQSLSAVQLEAGSDRVVVREGQRLWDAESGQSRFEFNMSSRNEALERPRGIASVRQHRSHPDGDPTTPRKHEATAKGGTGIESSTTVSEADRSPASPMVATQASARDWFALGSDLEQSDSAGAREAYRNALEVDPSHLEARVNLGRLLHEAGQIRGAETQYRMALEDHPENATVLFNLGVSLEDLGHHDDAVGAYRQAIAGDAAYADAYFNLARLLEKSGDSKSALRCLKTYRDLTPR